MATRPEKLFGLKYASYCATRNAYTNSERQLGKLPRYHKLTPKAAEVKVFYMTGTGADCQRQYPLYFWGKRGNITRIRVSQLLSSLSSWLCQFKLGGNTPAMGTRPEKYFGLKKASYCATRNAYTNSERRLGKPPRYHKLTPKAAEVKVFYMMGTGADCCAISALLLGEARKYYADA